MALSVNQNLIAELDKRIECIRRTYNDAELQALLKSLDESSSLVPEKETPPAPRRNAYFYLYVQRYERLTRLNVTKLSEAPVFELVCDFWSSNHRNSLSPVVCFNVESDFFMVGDVFIFDNKRPNMCKPFFDFFSVNTEPSFLPCPPTIAPGLAAQKVDPIIFTLHGKTYVLSINRYAYQPSSFEVFHNGKWETLPPPPYFSRARAFFRGLYACGHKVVFCFIGGLSYSFDTETVEWTDMQHNDQPLLLCAAEYNKFLIAKPYYSEELLVYELDADGFPHFYQDLDGLKELFADSRIRCSSNSYIIPFDNDADRFCFICSGTGPWINRGIDYFLRVAVFRMTISNLDGKKKLTAVLEAHQTYPFYKISGSSFQPHICSAFLKRDNLNLDNLKADRCLGRPYSD